MTSWAPLACGPLLLQDCVDVVHFAQPLEEGNEVQQLSVGHVIEPRGHRHLLANGHRQQQLIYGCNSSIFISGLHRQYKLGGHRSKVKLSVASTPLTHLLHCRGEKRRRRGSCPR